MNIVLSLTESLYEMRYIRKFFEKTKDMGIDSDFIYYTHGDFFSNIIPKKRIFIDYKLDNYLKIKDHRFYEDYLNFVVKNGSKAIIPRVIHPEFLYSSIISLKKCPNISLSGYAFELFIRSKSRANIVKKILELEKVKGLLLHTIGGKNAKWPPELEIDKNIRNKINIDAEPLLDSLTKFKGNKSKARKELSLKKNQKILLFFGTMYPWKGPETLLNSLEYLEDDFHIIFGGNIKTFYGDLEKLNNSKITLIDKPSDSLMYKLFHASDIVVCPYGTTYEYGTSNVCMSALLSKKPLVCPDLEPFTSFIQKYNCGEAFLSNNSIDLAKTINKISKNLGLYESQSKLGFNDFVKALIKWESIIRFHLN